MWRHHPQKHQFSVTFLANLFSQQQGICHRIFSFQKTVSPFGDLLPKKKSLIVTLIILV
jgi:hypothetical protein